MNGFLVGNPGDVEKQKLFVESLGEWVVQAQPPVARLANPTLGTRA